MTRNLLILRCLKNKLRKEKKKSIFFKKNYCVKGNMYYICTRFRAKRIKINKYIDILN